MAENRGGKAKNNVVVLGNIGIVVFCNNLLFLCLKKR